MFFACRLISSIRFGILRLLGYFRHAGVLMLLGFLEEQVDSLLQARVSSEFFKRDLVCVLKSSKELAGIENLLPSSLVFHQLH